jgi:hypothetical protein
LAKWHSHHEEVLAVEAAAVVAAVSPTEVGGEAVAAAAAAAAAADEVDLVTVEVEEVEGAVDGEHHAEGEVAAVAVAALEQRVERKSQPFNL